MKKIFTLCFLMALVCVKGWGQVSVTATAGTAGPTSYTTLNNAFAAINAGTHQGAIVISISANTTEPATGAVLNSTGAGGAVYTSVLIRPTADGISISAPTTTGLGVITLNGADNVTIDGDNPNTSGTNRNLSIINTGTNTVAYNSVVRIATGTGTGYISADNNTIKNCVITGNATGRNASGNTNTAGSENASFGVFSGGNGGSTVTAVTSVTSTTAASGTTINTLLVDNNAVNACARGIVFNTAATTVSTGVTITNNLVGDQTTTLTGTPPYTAPTTTVYTKGIYVAGTNAVTITGNTVKNIVSYVATQTSGIELNSLIGSNGVTINSNTVIGAINNSTAGAFGIIVAASTSNPTISGNTVSNVQEVGAGSTNIAGIQVSHSGTSALVEKNKVNTVYNRSTSGYGAYGINISAGSAYTIQNNFIWDINAYVANSALSTTYNIFGLRIVTGTNHKIYHNSINLYGAVLTGSTYASNSALLIVSTSSTGMDIRNNIFANTMTGMASSSSTSSIMLPSGLTNTFNLTLNNNAYYQGSGTGAEIGQIGTSAVSGYTAAGFNASSTTGSTNLRAYTSTLSSAGTNDNASYASTNAAPFISSTDLHLSPSSTEINKVESKGANLGVATDIDGDARGTTPDMGADEITIISGANDAGITGLATAITCPGSQNVVVIIKNYGTSPLTSATINWSINGTAQTAYTWNGNLAAGASVNVTIGTYNFLVNTSYTIIASTSSPNASTDANTANDTYTGTAFKTGLIGTITIGASGANYTTLTAAISDINSYGLCGATTLSLLNNYNSASETFPITLNAVTSATLPLTIKPASGATVSVSGSSSVALLVLNGADYVTIDGSNSGGTDRSLTFSNTYTTPFAAYVIQLTSLGTGAGAINNTIKNCIINTPTSTSYYTYGIYASGADHDNLTIQNNSITGTNYGIYAIGTSTGVLDNLLITGNTITESNATNTSYNSIGISVGYATGSTISLNTVSVSSGYTSSSPVGLSLGAGYVSSSIYKNTIAGVTLVSTTSGYAGKGIIVFTGSTTSALNIYNNFIYGVNGAQSSAGVAYAPMGIGIGVTGTGVGNATGGVNVYYNSISLTGTYASSVAAKTCALFVGASVTTVDLRNNILSNTLSNTGTGTTAKNYAIYSNATGAFSTIDYNDYYVSGAQGALGDISGTDYNTLADIQVNFGGNVNSKNVDPAFTSATNLHIPANTSSQLESGGVAITGITDDIDGETRAPGLTANGGGTAPDIGADEFDGIKPTNCTTPTAQPTALVFGTATATTVSGSFTAASPVPSSYIVFRSTSAIEPTPADGTTYSAGSSYLFNSVAYYVVTNGSATTFNDASLTANTQYYYYVFSLNTGSCLGGPKYLTTSPLSGGVLTCTIAATTLTGTSTSPTTATITYSGVAGATSTVLEYKPTSGTVWVTASPAPTTLASGVSGTYSLTGLTQGTTYDIRITEPNASCGTTKTTTSAFTTQAVTPSPWTEPFATSAVTPTGWTTTGWTIGSTRGATGNPGNNIYTNLYSLNTIATFTTINVGPLGTNDQLTFDYQLTNYASPYSAPAANTGNYVVYISTDYGATYTTLETVTNDGVAGWRTKTYPLAAYAGQTVKIKITGNWTSGNGGDYDLAFDNFSIAPVPLCNVPTGLTTSSITTTSATVSWTAPTAGTPAGYNYEVRTSGTGGSGATGLSASGSTTAPTTSASVTGLSSGTTYNLYVQTNCGGGSTSTWAGPYAFTTVCGTYPLPYTQNFDGVTAPALPNCTLVQNVNADAVTWNNISTTNASSTPNALFYGFNGSLAADDWWFTPGLNLTIGNSYQVVFKYRIASTTYPESLELKTGTSQSAAGMNTTALWSITNYNTSTTYQTITVNFIATAATQYFGWHINSAANEDGIYLDDIIIQAQPACTGSNGGTASASTSSLCSSGSAALSSTGYSTGNTSVYQWQYSTDGGNTFNDLSGQTSPASASTGTITTTTAYRLKVTCTSAGTTGYSNTVTVTVNNPLVASTTGGSTCGTGTVTLTATPSSGATINWYAASSGGAVLATGNSYTTPVISATTTYYASASTGSATVVTGPVSPTAQGGTIGTQTVQWDVEFTTLSATTLKSIDIFPVATGQAGELKIYSGSGTSGTVLATIPFTTNVSGGATAQTIPINYTISTPGAYTLYPSVMPSSGISRNISGAVYPYSSSVAKITANGYDQTYYMGFYNWLFGSSCESGRTSVVATVTTPPTAYSLTTSQTTSCADNPTAQLTLSGSEADVSYQLYNGSTAVGTPKQGTGTALDFGYVTVAGTYKVIGTRGTSCSTTMTGTPTITVTTITVYNVTGSGTTCSLGYVYLSGSQSGVTYRVVGVSGSTRSGKANGDTLQFPITATGTNTYYVSAQAGSCSEDMSGVATLTVNPTPIITNAPYTTSICNGTSFSVTPTSSVSGTTYTWGAPTYTGSVSGGAAQTTGQTTVSGTLSNTGTTNGTATYTVTPATSTCIGTSFTVTVTVNPMLTATINGPATTPCSGTGSGVTISSASGGIIYYHLSTSPTIARSVTLGAGTGNILTDVISTTTTYTLDSAKSTSGSCLTALSGSVTVTPTPIPNATITGSSYVVKGSTIILSGATSGGTWSSNPASVATVDGSTGAVTGVNYGTATITYTVATGNSCTGSSAKTVTVLAEYITRASGNFNSAGTWKTGTNTNAGYISASAAPTGSNNVILQHTVTLTADLTVANGKIFTINNTADTLAGSLIIAPNIAFSSDGSVNFNGRLVVLKSDATGTGAIGIMAAPIANATNVQVERFTDGKPSAQATGSRRAWRLITSPVTGQSIHQAWQENAASNVNPNPGYGTIITGENMADAATATSHGFDFIGSTLHTSIKHYVPSATSGSWLPLAGNSSTGTNIPLQNEQAYMLFVRGDRSVGVSGSSAAILRSTGTLQQSTRSLSFTAGNAFVLVGNPYASAIDFGHFYSNTTSQNSTLIQDKFYSWNSTIGTYGAYVLVTHDGTGANAGGYKATPSILSGVGVQNNDKYRFIPSSSGFFVFPQSAATSGTLSFIETDKAPGEVPPINPFRVVENASNVRELVVNLNQADSSSSSILADGFRAKFSADYEGSEEDNSSSKVSNFNENLGLVRNGINHIIEARGEVKKTDTLQLKMWNVSYRSYELQMQADNFTTPAPGIKAWLEDSYLQTKQAVSLTGGITTVSFEVNKDSGSWKSTRFRIVFENSTSVLPVTITKVSASPKNGGAEVAWTVSNEVNVKGYTVETSADGRAFTTVGTQQLAKNNPQASLTGYSGYDAQPKNGDNYYRIRIEGKDGQVSYSEIVKVTIGANGTGIQITLYPNPVREGKANLQMTNLKAGTYLVSVYTGSGQTVYQKKVTITLAGTTQSEPLLLGNNIAQGSYQIRIADHTGNILYSDKLVVGR